MFHPEAQAKIEAELATAESARANGNEGMARVCARRAAGAAIRAYFEKQNIPIRSASAIDLLNLLAGQKDLPPRAAEAIQHLLQRVDTHYNLSPGLDLLAETRWLIADLKNTLQSSQD